MDPVQVITCLGWIFFGGWGIVLAAVSVIAFGRDLLAFVDPARVERPPRLN